ncbi:hypothetical protein AG1IA_07298 [Rhizoctonia solani AG-1 IA]|uniref:Uncharacterized protein n=1 Tax=Thanatephorus cucumeris (strain AG1-IA) TaxID=983506 RepID=L8WQQ3_THACA|nr:hypothetical protein AG1IA_07298 [Rhizoctonia solani AG-1 IA]
MTESERQSLIGSLAGFPGVGNTQIEDSIPELRPLPMGRKGYHTLVLVRPEGVAKNTMTAVDICLCVKIRVMTLAHEVPVGYLRRIDCPIPQCQFSGEVESAMDGFLWILMVSATRRQSNSKFENASHPITTSLALPSSMMNQQVPVQERLGNARQSLRRPSFSIIGAGMQYTGSRSTRPG